MSAKGNKWELRVWFKGGHYLEKGTSYKTWNAAGERQEERYESMTPVRGIACSVNLLVLELEDQTHHCSQNVHWNNFCLMRSSLLKQTKKNTFTSWPQNRTTTVQQQKQQQPRHPQENSIFALQFKSGQALHACVVLMGNLAAWKRTEACLLSGKKLCNQTLALGNDYAINWTYGEINFKPTHFEIQTRRALLSGT